MNFTNPRGKYLTSGAFFYELAANTGAQAHSRFINAMWQQWECTRTMCRPQHRNKEVEDATMFCRCDWEHCSYCHLISCSNAPLDKQSIIKLISTLQSVCRVGFRPQEVFACVYTFPIAIMVTEFVKQVTWFLKLVSGRVMSFLGSFAGFWGGRCGTLELFGWGAGVSVKWRTASRRS